MLKKNKNKGILFWIEGFSGSGKTSISRKIYPKIRKLYGPTLIIQGDNFRKIFNLKSFSKKGRYENSKKYRKFSRYITDQNINLIFTVVGMMKETRKWLKKNVNNYVDIYIKSDLEKIKKKNKKKIYKLKNNIVGVHIKPDLPIDAKIIVNNDFSESIDSISDKLIKKIKALK
tara:strand:+ start:56 stop:574 length:519 start_codon:yes stop_codon:yes gene_type:complete